MAPTGETTEPNDRKNSFDPGRLTTLVSAVAAFAYVIGVVAINSYLHELGIVDFSFAKPKLLLTGILVLFTFLVLAFPLFFLTWSIASSHGQVLRTRSSLTHTLLSVFFFLFLLILASAWLCVQKQPSGQMQPGLGQITAWWIWELIRKWPFMKQEGFSTRPLAALMIALAVYVPVFLAVASAYVATRLFDQARSENPALQISFKWFYFIVAIGLVVMSTIGYIYVFTGTFYPAIPQEFGGGQPYYESFAIAEEDRCPLQQLGIPFLPSHQQNITEPLPVLHETDTLVAVWLKNIPSPNGGKGGDDGSWTSRFVVAELDKKQINAMTVSHAQNPVPSLSPEQCTSDSNTDAAPVSH
jgi:hypothetical protein